MKGFDINSLPGCRLLSEREKKLCASIKLRPTQYVTLKTLILKVIVYKLINWWISYLLIDELVIYQLMN